MKKIRVMDLPDWPPQPGGRYDGSYRVPTSEQAILKSSERTSGSFVTFVCEFEGKEHTYDLEVKNDELARKLEKVLRANVGKSIMQIGFLEIEA